MRAWSESETGAAVRMACANYRPAEIALFLGTGRDATEVRRHLNRVGAHPIRRGRDDFTLDLRGRLKAR